MLKYNIKEREERLSMETIDVKDLPEPIARGLEVVAEMARKLAGKSANGRNRVQLGVRDGTVYGTLSRKEIYEEDGS